MSMTIRTTQSKFNKPKGGKINLRKSKLIMDAEPGSNIEFCKDAAIAESITSRVDVEFVHNQITYIVRYHDLRDAVKVKMWETLETPAAAFAKKDEDDIPF